MNGTQLSKEVAADLNISAELVHRILMRAFAGIERHTSINGRCCIRGFGTFSIKLGQPKRVNSFSDAGWVEHQPSPKLVFTHGAERREIVTQFREVYCSPPGEPPVPLSKQALRKAAAKGVAAPATRAAPGAD